jgi:hypothetical protein
VRTLDLIEEEEKPETIEEKLHEKKSTKTPLGI